MEKNGQMLERSISTTFSIQAYIFLFWANARLGECKEQCPSRYYLGVFLEFHS